MQNPPTGPTAQGSFAKTPFPHLLVYALERALSGTFELHLPQPDGSAQSVATMLVIQGVPAKLRTTDGVHYLGDVMAELGLVSPEAVKASQERMAESPRLQGQILKELGAVDDSRLDAGVRAQLDRKLEHLFGLPSETVFSYYDGVDALQRYGGPPTPIDPLPALWRGVRQAPAWEHVDATLRRVGSSAVRIGANAQLDRFQFTRVEGGALDLLRQRPMRVTDLANSKVIGPSVAQLLIYVLVITKQVELIETPSMRAPAAAPAAQAASAASQAQQAPAAVPVAAPSTGRFAALGSQPGAASAASGQAFARVQLQAKPIQRAPLIVEEAPVARSASDGRIASPLPQAIPLPNHAGATNADPSSPFASTQGINPTIPLAPPAPVITGMPPVGPDADPTAGMNMSVGGLGLDIGAMISTTIQSSMPPPINTPDPGAEQGFMPAPPPSGSLPAVPPSSPSMNVPAAPPSQPPGHQQNLTAEQSSLKQKIIERAHAISSQDYFQMLGLERDATAEMVQKAFFGLAKVWHPDRLPPALVDVKDACSKVFTHLTEAQATLLDQERRTEYMTLLKDGGATPDDQAKIQAILEAATEFQKAEILMKRNDIAQAHELARKAHALDPEQADYLAMVTWLDAQKAEWIGREKTLEKIAVLDKCIKLNANSERAYFWRGMLYKRIDDTSKAMKDFKKAAELNPRNLDAMREVRLHNIRGGQSKPPPGNSSSGSSNNSGRNSQKPAKPAAPETLGGLFGKLFKK
ncbi:MAG: repeat/DnaJ domain/tetratricopeptide repeat protein [Myxococcaceae bacterium]|nr:repeat/DnaJ domain/tetratricopeptide repeat protein [Myxococcaceae bacterium]